MNMVKPAISAVFLMLASCAGTSVPNEDEIAGLLNAGDVDGARTSVQAALEADPQNRSLQLLKGRIAIDSGNPDLAIAALSPLMSDPAFAARTRDHLARAQLMAGKPRQALDTLGSTPDSALAYAVRTGALMQQGDAAAAARSLADGLSRHPDSVDLLVLDGGRAVAGGDVDRASRIAARAVKLAPRDVQARLLAGRVAMIDRDYAAASRHFDAVLALRPRHQTALLAKATMAMDSDNPAEAEKLLARAAEQLGDNAPAIAYYRAQIAYDRGRIDEALRLIQAIGDTSAFPPATMLAGLVAARRGQDEQAIVLLRRYLDGGNEDGRARFALAGALERVGEKEEAWTTIRPLARAANASPQALALAARLAEVSGSGEAAALRARAAKLAGDAGMANELADASKAIQAGKWARAEAIYARLLRASPSSDNVVLLNNAAYARLELGDATGALTLARRALALAPDDPIVLDTAAWAAFKAHGPTAEATALIGKAAGAMPSNVQIRRHSLAITEAARAGSGS